MHQSGHQDETKGFEFCDRILDFSEQLEFGLHMKIVDLGACEAIISHFKNELLPNESAIFVIQNLIINHYPSISKFIALELPRVLVNNIILPYFNFTNHGISICLTIIDCMDNSDNLLEYEELEKFCTALVDQGISDRLISALIENPETVENKSVINLIYEIITCYEHSIPIFINSGLGKALLKEFEIDSGTSICVEIIKSFSNETLIEFRNDLHLFRNDLVSYGACEAIMILLQREENFLNHIFHII